MIYEAVQLLSACLGVGLRRGEPGRSRGRCALALAAICATGIGAIAGCGPTVKDGADWPSHGRTGSEQRFSPLTEITSANVSRLGLAWSHQFNESRSQQATPVVQDGVLYTSTSWSNVYAFDARTGRLLWSFDAQTPRASLGRSCCDAVNRGVALSNGKVFVGTFDGRLVALDAASGKQVWSVLTVDPSKPYTITGAPRVAKGKVLIGNGGADFGVRGYISAYDAETGKLAWRFYTVPNAEGKPDGAVSDAPLARLAHGTWFGGTWKLTGGGGTVWDSMAYDPDADLLYFGVGNGSPHTREARSDGKGDNLFLASIIAVRPSTGEYVWHYQETPGESWDYTATQSIVLADIELGGQRRKVLLHAPKNGFFYVLDRLTGKLISADPFARVNWATGVDINTGRPIEVPAAREDNFHQLPGPLGAHAAQPMAFDPRSGLVFIPVQESGFTYKLDKSYRFQPGRRNSGTLRPDPRQPAPAADPPWGALTAWDPVARKIRWSVRRPHYYNGGVLATGGGLVFQGVAEGEIEARSTVDGRKLWSFPTGQAVVASPITYSTGGSQYVAVLVGFGGSAASSGAAKEKGRQLPGRLLVFKLGGKARPPPLDPPVSLEPIDVAGLTSTGDPEKGFRRYQEQCVSCHGVGATSGFNADLRRSGALRDPAAWKSVVIDGILSDNGMVSFADLYSPSEAEDIRAYVLTEARRAPRKAGGGNRAAVNH